MDPQMRLQLEIAYEALENGLRHVLILRSQVNTR